MVKQFWNNKSKSVEVKKTSGTALGLATPGGFAGSQYKTPDSIFRFVLNNSVILLILIILAMVITLFVFSLPAIKHTGFTILTGTNWDPDHEIFGGAPFIVGTLITSVLALLISLPFSLSIAIFLGEYVRKGVFFTIINSSIELLAGIPSIIFGAWGLNSLVPLVQKWQHSMNLQGSGLGILSASLVLSIMIIPFSASIAREIISLVPGKLKEAIYSLGATRYDMVKMVAMPYARSGIFAGLLLAFGRALGETMAVTMVIGNRNELPSGIFSAGNTISSVIVNEYAEGAPLHLSALTELGLILFTITILFGLIGRIFIRRMEISAK